ncbi:PAS domain S-box protein [Laspinema olomoucense]|uniref:PAS domain S-box protein n=1 Tax=Laspinema olomoucense TaxID=3231600 RepID=UPI0021BADAD3|nr:PAS domain S-box protein [Laspinema sp. D3c]MCT7995005.1 PAS domain S-box protein [Laspinema sp. D3c]
MNAPGDSHRFYEALNTAKTETEAIHLISTIFFKLSADLFCIIGTDGYFKRVNPAWTHLLGWTQEELLGRPWSEFLHPEDRDLTITLANPLPQSDISIKNRYRHKNGTYRWFAWKACHYPDSISYAVGRDITAQQELEAALHQSERHYRNLVETSRDLIWSLDQEGRWTFVNPAAQEIYGYAPQEMLGRFFFEFMDPEQGVKDRQMFDRLQAGESVFPYETQHRCQDGTPVFLSFNGVLMRDELGNIIGTTGTATDITHRKQAESALQESQQKLAIHLQQTPLAAIEWNLKFEVSNWNPAAERLFGYTREEILGHHALELIPEKVQWEVNEEVLQALLHQEGGIYSTNENQTKDGRVIICEWHNTPLVDSEGQMIGVASLVQDVTEKFVAIRALEQSEARFQKLADNIPGLIYQSIIHQDGSVSFPFLSSGCLDVMEVDPDYMKQHPNILGEMIHPEDRPSYERSIAAKIQPMEPWRWEGRFIMRSGKLKWLQCVARAEQQENGDILWEGVMIDITDRKLAEKAVTQSEAKWRSLIQNSSDMITILEPDGTIRYHSPSVERILGYYPEELIGQKTSVFVHPDDVEKVKETYQMLTNHPDLIMKIEYRVQRATREILYFESIGRNLLAETAVNGLVINSRDITSHKIAEEALNHANTELERRVKQRTSELNTSLEQLRIEILERANVEAALRESEQRFRAIFEGAAIGIVVRTLDWEILDSNPAFQSMLGYSAEELQGTICLELSDPLDQKAERLLAAEMIRGQRKGYQIEKRYRCKNGSRIWSRLSVSLVSGKGETPQFAIAMVEDITARKQAESELILTRKAVESSGDAIAISNRFGSHIYHNSAFSHLYEYETPEQLNAAGGPLAVFADPILGTQVFETIMQGDSWSGEVIHRTSSDRTIPVLLSADAIKDPSGTIVGLISISTDISQRVRAEQDLKKALHAAEAASRSKSTFLANMSHELRTPLNAIIGYSEILAEEMEDAGEQQAIADLTKIRTAGKHLLSLINDILDISKIEAGRMTLYLEPFDITLLISEVISTVEPLIEKNGNHLEINCDPSVGMMTGDLTKVRQILFNLLSNAAKFTENGTIALTVTPRESGEWVGDPVTPDTSREQTAGIEFRVTDTGIGISSEQLANIFEAFSQADASTTRKYGGTGLGLAISQRFCKMMGGEILVESEAEKGSTFTLWLPMNMKQIAEEIEA